jgi:Na+/H+ antiporter NhaD/arsenite permease-like protein
MTASIVILFLFGYFLITMENSLKVNKTAIALLLSVTCWMLYMANCEVYVNAFHAGDFARWQKELGEGTVATAASYVINKVFIAHVGDTSEIIFFLLGAMTIVEVVDANGGFDFVREKVKTKSQRSLLWRITFMTFFISAVLDNLTTTIVMIMVLRKLVPQREVRLRYAGMIVLAANAGGAFSPIGDVTTIMLWIKGNISTLGVLKEVFLPAIACILVPLLLIQRQLKGSVADAGDAAEENASNQYDFSRRQRHAVFYVGVVGLVLVPIFRSVTGLPPFMGIILVLSLLWVMTEFFYRKRHVEPHISHRVSDILHSIDLSTILFFLGILMAVAALQETGVLSALGRELEAISGGNAYIVTGAIGLASSIVDNVPLVASCMGMYDIATPAAALANPELASLVQDGTFWQLLGFCAGTGGSILIIGSAAGVVVMGLERITFGWYLKHFSLLALAGFLSGMVIYWLEKTFIF